MDNPTHLLTGYFMSRAGLNRLTPYATAILLIAANIPDADIAAIAGGWTNYLNWHRSWTHALVLSPLMALATVAIVRLAVRKPLPWIAATLVAWAGVLSHLLLDWTNQYGIRFLLPFSPRWYELDNASLFDPWIFVIFGVCLFAPLLARLVGGEITGQIGPRTKETAGRGWAITALVLLCLYFVGRGVLHGRAMEILNSRNYDDAEPLRVAAFPHSSPLVWRGVVETPIGYHVYTVDLLREAFDPGGGRTLFKPQWNAAMLAARKTREFQVFQEFAQYPLWQTVPSAEVENGTQVDLVDMRFPFHCRAIVDGTGRVRRTEYPVYGW